MTYTADVSMFPYFKNELKENVKSIVDYQNENTPMKLFCDEDGNNGVYMPTINGIGEALKTMKYNWKQQKKDNEKLQYQNNKWGEMLDEFKVDSRVDIYNMIYTLQEENEKFKKAYEDQHKYSCELGDFIDKQKEENEKLKEFKEKAEEECEASAVMEDMMVRIEKAERNEKEAKRNENSMRNCYDDQLPRMNAIVKENNDLSKIVIGIYNLEEQGYVEGIDWDERMRNCYNQVMSGNNNIDWVDILDGLNIKCESHESILYYFTDDRDIREQYCNETQGDEEEAPEEWNSIVENSDLDDCEEAFIEWYLNDYCKSDGNWWCDYDCGYWWLGKEN